MKGFDGRDQIIIHVVIISFREDDNFGIKIGNVNVVNFTIIVYNRDSTKEVNVRHFRDESGAAEDYCCFCKISGF